MRVAQPSGKFYHSKFLRDLCDIWDLRGSGLTNMYGLKGAGKQSAAEGEN